LASAPVIEGAFGVPKAALQPLNVSAVPHK